MSRQVSQVLGIVTGWALVSSCPLTTILWDCNPPQWLPAPLGVQFLVLPDAPKDLYFTCTQDLGWAPLTRFGTLKFSSPILLFSFLPDTCFHEDTALPSISSLSSLTPFPSLSLALPPPPDAQSKGHEESPIPFSAPAMKCSLLLGEPSLFSQSQLPIATSVWMKQPKLFLLFSIALPYWSMPFFTVGFLRPKAQNHLLNN